MARYTCDIESIYDTSPGWCCQHSVERSGNVQFCVTWMAAHSGPLAVWCRVVPCGFISITVSGFRRTLPQFSIRSQTYRNYQKTIRLDSPTIVEDLMFWHCPFCESTSNFPDREVVFFPSKVLWGLLLARKIHSNFDHFSPKFHREWKSAIFDLTSIFDHSYLWFV